MRLNGELIYSTLPPQLAHAHLSHPQLMARPSSSVSGPKCWNRILSLSLTNTCPKSSLLGNSVGSTSLTHLLPAHHPQLLPGWHQQPCVLPPSLLPRGLLSARSQSEPLQRSIGLCCSSTQNSLMVIVTGSQSPHRGFQGPACCAPPPRPPCLCSRHTGVLEPHVQLFLFPHQFC